MHGIARVAHVGAHGTAHGWAHGSARHGADHIARVVLAGIHTRSMQATYG
jgi:hypothetical protein